MDKLEDRAKRFIKNDNKILYDIAAHYGQIVDNVRNTEWFLNVVKNFLKTNELP